MSDSKELAIQRDRLMLDEGIARGLTVDQANELSWRLFQAYEDRRQSLKCLTTLLDKAPAEREAGKILMQWRQSNQHGAKNAKLPAFYWCNLNAKLGLHVKSSGRRL